VRNTESPSKFSVKWELGGRRMG